MRAVDSWQSFEVRLELLHSERLVDKRIELSGDCQGLFEDVGNDALIFHLVGATGLPLVLKLDR